MDGETVCVLLVEDEEAHAELVRRAFQPYADRMRLMVAGSLEEAKNLQAECSPGLIIADWLLPDGKGTELLAVADGAQHVPLVLMTSRGNERVAVEAIKAGALDYVVKSPATLADMPHIAERALREWDHIAERKRVEQALQASEARWARTFDAVPDLIAIIGLDHRILRANKAMAQRLGLAPEACVGLTCYSLAHRTETPLPFCPLAQLLQDGQEHEAEVTEENLGGTFVITASPLLDAEGRLAGSVHVARDVTERKRAEEALRQYTTELEVRNEELDAFAHTAAHDLKNPLSLIVGLAETLELDYMHLQANEVSDYLHRLVQHALKMNNIIDELLLLAGVRQTEVKLDPLDIASIVTGALQRLTYLTEAHRAEIILPNAWPETLGYAPWVEEVWVNYLSNAIKYGGRPPRVELGAETQADGAVRFSVRDNGPGIAVEDQARLFTPFTRLDYVRAKGHGLGLSIVRRIVEKLGGQVGVQSQVGHGSTFYFILPGSQVAKHPFTLHSETR